MRVRERSIGIVVVGLLFGGDEPRWRGDGAKVFDEGARMDLVGVGQGGYYVICEVEIRLLVRAQPSWFLVLEELSGDEAGGWETVGWLQGM